MKVTREKTENSQAFLRIEMEPAEVEESLEQSYQRLAKKANIPGFRKGKAPRVVLERYIGKDSLLEDALNNLLPQAYEKALKEQEIEAIANPSIEIAQTDPVVFKATVPLKPTIELGDYQQIRLAPEPVELTEDEVNTVIEQLRRQHATWEPVERPADFDDLVALDIESHIEEKPFINQQGVQYQILHDQPLPVPGFAEQLSGMKGGEEKEFKLKLPEDYSRAELAGKEARFKVRVSEIKQQRLPELDDEFASLVNPDLKTLDSLRERISANLRLMAEEKAKREFEERVVEAVVDSSQVEFPPVLVEMEIARLFDQQARQLQTSNIGLEEYLGRVGKTEEELREELRPLAIKRVTSSLVLGRTAEEEKIEVSDAEINAELENMVQSVTGNKDEVKKRLDSPQARDSIGQLLATRKTIQRLVEIAGGSTNARKK
ncbi:MAG: trigger factor [Dehalococcoidales bacterium]|nr:trigger factor [Dehalococcoidales bacterium]